MLLIAATSKSNDVAQCAHTAMTNAMCSMIRNVCCQPMRSMHASGNAGDGFGWQCAKLDHERAMIGPCHWNRGPARPRAHHATRLQSLHTPPRQQAPNATSASPSPSSTPTPPNPHTPLPHRGHPLPNPPIPNHIPPLTRHRALRCTGRASRSANQGNKIHEEGMEIHNTGIEIHNTGIEILNTGIKIHKTGNHDLQTWKQDPQNGNRYPADRPLDLDSHLVDLDASNRY